MRQFIARLLGGRPMHFVAPGFVDQVTGEPVSLYRDYFGRWWLAVGRWDSFRIPVKHPRAWLAPRVVRGGTDA